MNKQNPAMGLFCTSAQSSRNCMNYLTVGHPMSFSLCIISYALLSPFSLHILKWQNSEFTVSKNIISISSLRVITSASSYQQLYIHWFNTAFVLIC
jgi:hypothetical protein